jgi:hypothetical protein
VRILAAFTLILIAGVGCGPTSTQIALERGLKAATSRSTGCPVEKLEISDHRPRLQSWMAKGCHKTYRCVSINVEMELAECQSGRAVSLR